MSLPAADDLFRPTVHGGRGEMSVVPPAAEDPAEDAAEDAAQAEDLQSHSGPARRPSGRVRHDEKMTVYVTSDELLDLEHARLLLRRSHGLAVDRGRMVREAIALVLADLEAHGEDSALVRRLTEE